jgi:hypothetical protein
MQNLMIIDYNLNTDKLIGYSRLTKESIEFDASEIDLPLDCDTPNDLIGYTIEVSLLH